jgi:hypothetical protein
MQLGIILDIQHAGRKSRPTDLGASADLDGDGVIERDEHEARLTPLYAMACQALALRDGVKVLRIDGGEYSARHRMAVDLAASDSGRRWLYVACHLNAGGGNYGLVIADQRSTQGRNAAREVAEALGELPELRAPKGRTIAGVTAAEGSDWPRAWGTIAGIGAPGTPRNIAGICFEPCFMDTPSHRSLLTAEGPTRIGEALYRGAVRWAAA